MLDGEGRITPGQFAHPDPEESDARALHSIGRLGQLRTLLEQLQASVHFSHLVVGEPRDDVHVGFLYRRQSRGEGEGLGYLPPGLLELSQPGSFQLTTVAEVAETAVHPPPHWADLDNFIYYSLVTLSTLGYGDIVAVSRAARSLSALEAIVGQLYLAILLARLIGLHIVQKRGEVGG